MTFRFAVGLFAAVMFGNAAIAELLPNFVILIADDLNWDDTGAYGNPAVHTPSIDRLAREGMTFHQAFVTASSCSPSRASLITGRYPHATDAEQLHWPVPADQRTFIQDLHAAGYWCAAAGKWHLGEPVKAHFDDVREADPAGFQLPTNAEGETGRMVATDPSGCGDWLPILRDRPRDQPFCLWLAALDPHREYDDNIIEHPHSASEVRVPATLPDVPAVREELRQYYDEITRLDGYVGEVLRELEDQNVLENTFVIFLSDNGRPFPRDKTTVYDGGIRTPWIVRWPSVVPPGSRCDRLVSAVDLAPTLLEVAGLEIPATVQGISFLPLLTNPRQPVRKFIFAEDHWHDYEDFSRAVRSERYKYIRNYYADLPGTPPADVNRSNTTVAMRRLNEFGRLTEIQASVFRTPRSPEELYDTVADPFEMHNLATDPDHNQHLNRLKAELVQWQQETEDRIPTQRTPDEFDRQTGEPLPNRIRPRPSKQAMFSEDAR